MKSSMMFFLGILASTITLGSAADRNSPFALNRSNYEAAYSNRAFPANVTRKNTWTNTIPKVCVDAAAEKIANTNKPKCSLANMRVVEAWFYDAPDSWVVCHCVDNTHKFTIDQYLKEIGKLEPGIRQYIRYFVGLPSPNSNGATATGTATGEGDVLLYGFPTSLLLLHVAGHTIDSRSGYAFSSNTQTFPNAARQDTCWVTAFARDNSNIDGHWYTEPWAEVFVARRLQKLLGNGFAGGNLTCTQKQLNVVASQTDSVISAGYTRGKRSASGVGLKRNEIPSF